MKPLLAGLVALAALLPVLAGCVAPDIARGGPPVVGPAGADLWEEAAARHPASAEVRAPRLTLAGDLHPLDPGRQLRLVPAPDLLGGLALPPGAPAPRSSPETRGPLLFERARVDGQEGTVLASFPEVRLTTLAGGFALNASAVRGQDGALRAAVQGLPRLPLEPTMCAMGPSGPSCPPAPPPLPEEHRAGLLTALQVALPARFVVEGANLTFVDGGGNRTPLGASATLDGARALLAAGPPGFGSVDAALDAPLPLRWTGNLTLQAEGAQGTLRLAGADRPLQGDVDLALRGDSRSSLRYEGGAFVVGLAGDATDVVAGGEPRLGARLAAVPGRLDAAGPAGKVARVQLLLVETSGGAAAHLDGFRVEGPDTVEVRFVGQEPFQMTQALLDAMDDIANQTELAPFTAPALVALGLTLPWLAIAEAFFAFALVLVPPQLEGAVPAGGAQVATFELSVPPEPAEVVLVLQGQNFEEQRVRVALRPEA